jgi:S-methylmethionine-dependent homocysteine/selenocysteine methylase
LIRLEEEEKAAKADEPGDPLALLKEMSGPIAAYLAQEHNLDFQLSEEQQAAYQNYRRKIAIEYLDEQRAKAQISPGAKSNGHTGGTS